MKTKEILQKIFGITSGLFLLYYAIIFTPSIVHIRIINWQIQYGIFLLLLFASAVLLLLKNILKNLKISEILIVSLLIMLPLMVSFLGPIPFGPLVIKEFCCGLLIVVLLNIFLLHKPRKSRGVFMIVGAAMFLLFSIINSASIFAVFFYSKNSMLSLSEHILSLMLGISRLSEGIYVLINAIGRKFNKKTYIILIAWGLLNIILSAVIPAREIELGRYFIFSLLGMIDTYLIYFNIGFLKCVSYFVFIYDALNFNTTLKVMENIE